MIAIYCAGSLGKEIAGMLEIETREDIIFIDDVIDDDTIIGYPKYSYEYFCTLYSPEEVGIIIATGEPYFRKKIKDKIISNGYSLKSFISNKAYINKSAMIGKGVIIFPNSYISYGVEIKDNTVIHSNSQIEATSIGCDCFCSLGVFVGANTIVGNTNFLGPHAVIRDSLSIGDNNIIGMNSVVLKSVNERQILVGNPARILRENTENIVFKK